LPHKGRIFRIKRTELFFLGDFPCLPLQISKALSEDSLGIIFAFYDIKTYKDTLYRMREDLNV